MSTSSKSATRDPSQGRKAAYFARNRAALIAATQLVLAEYGPQATVEQVAEEAEVSISTIYQHFDTKESLFHAALATAMTDWESWMADVMSEVTDPLEELITPIRLFLRMRSTHPRYAQLLARNLALAIEHLPTLSATMHAHARRVAEAGVLTLDSPDIQLRNLTAVIVATMQEQLHNPNATDAAADEAIEIGLGMLGITPATAHQLMTAALPEMRN